MSQGYSSGTLGLGDLGQAARLRASTPPLQSGRLVVDLEEAWARLGGTGVAGLAPRPSSVQLHCPPFCTSEFA